MKKKNLSFMTLFMLTASLIGGCSCNKQSNENVSNLVIKVGEKEYSANELYNDLLSKGVGANEAFAKILRMVVESSMETSTNIKAAADLAVENFETEVENDAITNGTSTDDSRKKLLEQKGYESIDEMRSDIIYEQKLTRVTDAFWEENKANYYNDFVENRLPYLIRHVLVKVSNSSGADKIANNAIIKDTEAEKLFNVIKRFEKGGAENRFSYIASNFSEDPGSIATGGAYYMDNTSGASGFVDEFAYGVYAFDTYTTKQVEDGVTKYVYGANQDKLNKLKGLSDTETFAKYYENGFNFVSMDEVNMLGEVYDQTNSNEKDYFEINAYNKEIGENQEVSYKTASGNNNSTSNYYARAIIFNRAFNKPGVSVIGYNTKEEAEANAQDNYVELKMGNTSKYILTDDNKNPIFFVAARGDSNNIWVHFLTINVSALNDLEDAKKFFTLSPDKTDNYTSYVELMDIENSAQSANSYISKLETYVKSYATAGLGETIGTESESLLNYDLVEYYINKNQITTLNEELMNAIKTYIANRKTYFNTKVLNSVSEDWDTHTDKLGYYMGDYNQMGIKPFECAVLVNKNIDSRDNPYTALTSSDRLCRYVYGEGYQIQLSYYYETTSTNSTSTTFTKLELNDTNSNNRNLYFNSVSGYKQWVSIGETNSNHIVLPTPEVKDGYIFRGWYTDKDLEHEVQKDSQGKYYIDLSETRMTNNTIFFADVVQDATTINYIYKFADGTLVNDDVLANIKNTNVTSKRYSSASGADNTVTFDATKVGFASGKATQFTAVKFMNGDMSQEITNLTITESDMTKTIDVVVIVEAAATTIEYEFINADGTDALANADTNNNPTTATYVPGSDNEVNITLENFEWNSTYRAKEIKVARDDKKYDDESNADSLTLSQKDMGKTIKVYVIVEEIA